MDFVTRDQLGFDLAALIEDAIDDWSKISGTAIDDPPSEACGDFIASEMDARGLHRDDPASDEAFFDADPPPAQFRDAVLAGLNRWLIETEPVHPLTTAEADEYGRKCGE